MNKIQQFNKHYVIQGDMFQYREDGTVIINKAGVCSLYGESIPVNAGDLIDVEKKTINGLPINDYKMRLSLDRFICKPTGDKDPYWDLFKVKEQMNDALVAAVQYGYEKGYKAAKGEMI